MLIEKQGVYDIPAEQYHADPAPEPSLSASIGNTLVNRSPDHARTKHPRLNPEFVPEEKDCFDLGAAAHNMVLRQDFWREQIAVVDAKDWRTKAAKAEKAKAHEENRTPVLTDQYDELDRMVRAIEEHPQASKAFRNGKPEQTLVWRDAETGIWMRCRPDWMPDNRQAPWPDYKTTADARPATWDRRFLLDHGGLMRAAFYEEGIRQVCGVERPTLYYVVQETGAPYAVVCRVMDSSSQMMRSARGMLRKAVHTWADCLKSGKWPSYQLVGPLGLSEWAETALATEYHEWIPRAEEPELEKVVIP